MTTRAVDRPAPTPHLLRRRSLFERRVGSVVGVSIALTLLGLGVALLLTALVDVTESADNAIELAAVGLACLAGTSLGLAVFQLPDPVPASRVLPAIVSSWLTVFAVSTAVYAVTGVTDRIDDALFESVSGYTTTGLTTVVPETLSRGLLFWRALNQWMGGLAALMLGVAVIPFFGAERAHVDSLGGAHGAPRLAPRVRQGFRNLAQLYAVSTLALFVAFVVAGMGVFDGISYSLTTVSTGGFANHSSSFAHFDSAAIEWVAVAGMGIAGANIAVLWWALVGATRPLRRSIELRVYLGLMAVSAALATAWTWQDTGGGHATIRHAAFSVVSLTSTTGHRVVEWADWATATQGLILVLLGIGSMGGSAGGGFSVTRVLHLWGSLRRELRYQLHPRAVIAVKLSGRSVTEASLAGAAGYQLLYLAVGGAGAIGIAAFGSDLLTSTSASLAALATVGPALGDLGAFGDVSALDRGARAVLMVLMFAGRLAIYPLLIAAGALVRSLREVAR